VSILSAKELPEDLANDEKMLKEAKVATDGPGLLAYVKDRTLSLDDRKKLAELVPLLGDRKFSVREDTTKKLIAAGRVAIPHLKRGLTSKDPEIARRCEFAIDEIDRNPHVVVMSSVTRLLAYHKPAGTIEALLAYLPCNDDEGVEEVVLTNIAACIEARSKPTDTLVKGATDKDPVCRMAVAAALANADRKEATKLLTELARDKEPLVRYHAARSLIRLGDKDGVTVLLALLTDAPVRYAYEIEDVLFRIAGDEGLKITGLGDGEEKNRKAARKGWEDWWVKASKTFDPAKVNFEEAEIGVTLYCEYDGHASGGRVWLAGRDGKERWAVTGLSGPNDARLLPGGRVLVAERNANKFTERDQTGKVLWEYTMNDGAIAVDRLPNGNTLCAGWTTVCEVTKDGKVVWTFSCGLGVRYAYRLKNGSFLIASANGPVVELDAKGKEVRQITPQNHGGGTGYWSSVELLSNGRYLMALGSSGKIVEIDKDGKVLWETSVPNAVWAQRTRNGNTLISNFETRQVVEVDRTGKELKTTTLPGRMFTVRRY